MNDRRVVLAVVLSIAAIGIVIVAGAMYLTAQDKSAPEALITLAGTCVGALAGILVNSSSRPVPPAGG